MDGESTDGVSIILHIIIPSSFLIFSFTLQVVREGKNKERRGNNEKVRRRKYKEEDRIMMQRNTPISASPFHY